MCMPTRQFNDGIKTEFETHSADETNLIETAQEGGYLCVVVEENGSKTLFTFGRHD